MVALRTAFQKPVDSIASGGFFPGMAKRVKPSMGCAGVLFGILLLAGGGLLTIPWRAPGRPDTGAYVAGGFGLALVIGAFAYLRFARREVARHKESERIAAAHPGKPWLQREEWRRPALESKEGGSTAALWFFTLFWNGISGVAAWAVLTKDHEEKGVYFVLLFPLIGVFLLWAAIHQTIKWRKFGRVRFVASSLPGAIGGYLGGVIEVPARLVLESDARVALRCVRRVTSGSGKNRSTRDSVIWEHEELVARDQFLGAADRTDIPVLFYIPPTCEPWNDDDLDHQVIWRLVASAAVPGVDFSTTFEVPVFVTGETAAPPEPGRPLLAEYRSGAPADAETLARAGVKVASDGFTFSAGHLATSRLVTTLVFLAMAVFALVLLFSGAQFVLVGLVAFFAGLAGLFAADLWSDRFELKVVGPEIVVTQSRPWGAKVTRVPRAEVAEVRTQMSMSTGESRYYRLTLVGHDGLDPRQPQANEGFDARKLRFQLKRVAKELGVQDPAKLGERGTEIFAAMARTPKFQLVIAKHLAGQATAEAVAATVLERIRDQR